MPGNLRLRPPQYPHEAADTDFLVTHQVQQPQARVIAECLKERLHVEFDFTAHTAYIRFDEYECKRYICVDVCEVRYGGDS